MTYLEIVNKVLRRLREPTVTTVTENSYSALVGEFVNDAKRFVEDSWQWRALHDKLTIPLTIGQESFAFKDYNTTATGVPPTERARLQLSPTNGNALIRVIDTASSPYAYYEGVIVPFDYNYIGRSNATAQGAGGVPREFVFSPAIRSGWTSGQSTGQISPLSPVTSGSYSVDFLLVNPQEPLDQSSAVLAVPADPVIQYAYLYCLYERGEELGEMLNITAEKAKASLADAISLDQTTYYPELVFSSGE